MNKKIPTFYALCFILFAIFCIIMVSVFFRLNPTKSVMTCLLYTSEPEEQETKDTNLYCTFTITCSTILDNIDDLDPEKIELVPKDGIIPVSYTHLDVYKRQVPDFMSVSL